MKIQAEVKVLDHREIRAEVWHKVIDIQKGVVTVEDNEGRRRALTKGDYMIASFSATDEF